MALEGHNSALDCDNRRHWDSLRPRLSLSNLLLASHSRLVTMASHRDANFPSKPYIEPAPVPGDQPKVEEVGTTSAPLKSASFFLGEHCSKYNEDFMLCKNESRDPAHCLKEGRRVTRCAQDL